MIRKFSYNCDKCLTMIHHNQIYRWKLPQLRLCFYSSNFTTLKNLFCTGAKIRSKTSGLPLSAVPKPILLATFVFSPLNNSSLALNTHSFHELYQFSTADMHLELHLTQVQCSLLDFLRSGEDIFRAMGFSQRNLILVKKTTTFWHLWESKSIAVMQPW